LLNHYVFDDENPVAHVPAARRGILGRLTPELITKLKESIRRYL
jgi:hypothetical protein